MIIGRTNVGKSTLFNRLVEKNQALVSNIENTTRDFNHNIVDWNGVKVNIVDTAGVVDTKYLKDPKTAAKKLNAIDFKSQKQLADFFKQADCLLLTVDLKAGLLKEDKDLAYFIKKRSDYLPKTILVVNKADSFKLRSEAAVFYKLGLGEPLLLSAATGSGTGDLLDSILKITKKTKKRSVKAKSDIIETEERIKVGIMGQPNVGKSSFVNAVLGYERVIVSDIAHTTREPQNTEFMFKNNLIELIDTAGISQHGHKKEGLEKHGILKTWSTMKKADIILLILDLNRPFVHQDARLVEKITEAGKSLIIVGNKWDTVTPHDPKIWTAKIYEHLPFIIYAPVVFTSAISGEKVNKVLDVVLEVATARKKEVSDSQLSHFLNSIVKKHKPAKAKGTKPPHIYEIKQLNTDPPRFEIRIGAKDTLHFSYIRFVENRLRDHFGFLGTPIRMKISNRPHIHGKAEDPS